MKLKGVRLVMLSLFLVTVFLNYLYGSILYSKVLGKEQQYTIGKECDFSRSECERRYFQSNLDKIDSISNASRRYFSEIAIERDQAGYSGNCPCPNDLDSAGGICGARSSYSKNGTISYCYDSDVSDSQVAEIKDTMLVDAREELDNAVQETIKVYREHYTLIIIVAVYGALLFFTEKKWRQHTGK